MAVLYGVRGLSSYFNEVSTGTGSLPNDYVWQMESGFRSYLTKSLPDPTYEQIIEDLLDQLPTEIDIRKNLPGQFELSQNYPNPFNPSTTIEFDLPKFSNVRIEVYNLTGQKVQTLLNKKMTAGSHRLEFNAQNLSSGVYFYRIEAGEFQDVKKMILIK